MSIIRLYRRVIGKFIRIRIKKSINGKGNRIFFDRSLTGGTLRIIISGNNNEIVVGPNCWFQGVNTFFIVGDNNRIDIGQGVTFDGKVDFVLGEGTSVKIGDDCMFANNVLFRTSDQHAIYNADNERINRGGGYFNRCTCVVGTKSDGYEECNSRKRNYGWLWFDCYKKSS